MRRDSLIFIVGPTAVGKTRLALKLAARIGGEIISADSMQAYKGMRVLSQAPARKDRQKVTHHLVGTIDPAKEYNAALFIKKAGPVIDSVLRRGKKPIIAGGSGLYIKALIDGLFPAPSADKRFRQRMYRHAGRCGTAALYKRLRAIDPASAGSIHPNDLRRIIRALEIYDLTGRTMTELKSRTKGLSGKYNIVIFGLMRSSREKLYSDIDARVDAMFMEGLVREVKRLRKRRVSKTARAALGFKEISGYLDGDYDIDTARSMLKMNTRRFAKRQMTWFRADKRIRWFDMDRLSANEIVDLIKILAKGA